MKTAAELTAELKNHPDMDKAGMMLCHTGLVRATSRDGRPVTGLRVVVDNTKLEEVLAEGRAMPGIVDVRIVINAEKDLIVGDPVMHLAVAGDFRENVIGALSAVLNKVKATVTAKTEYFVD